jgi:hypothetical protein
MDYADFIHRVIEEGLAACKESYKGKDVKLKGAIEGFEACRIKLPEQLAVILQDARKETAKAHIEKAPDYWRYACKLAEIEWVCNCVSAMLLNEGRPTITPPTVRGMMKAASIIGVRQENV